MTLTFRSGSDFTGEPFLNLIEGLEKIRDILVIAGWEIILDDITTNQQLDVKGQDEANNNHKCYFSFTGNIDGDIDLKGFLGDIEDNNEVSPIFTFPITDGEDNRLWLTCDSGTAILLIFDGSVTFSNLYSNLNSSWSNGVEYVHFGFLNRVNPNDKYAWYINRINYRYDHCYCAKSAHNNTIWRQLSNDYDRNNEYNDVYQLHPVQGVFDCLTVARPRYHFNSGSNNNAGYVAYKGAVNAVDGKPYFGNFYYLEGRGSTSNYGNNPPYALYYRGNIKYAITGLASLIAFEIYNDQYGNKWMSCNNYGAQGMQIA